MNKKMRNNNENDNDHKSRPLSAREILSGAGRKSGKSRIDKYRKKTTRKEDGWADEKDKKDEKSKRSGRSERDKKGDRSERGEKSERSNRKRTASRPESSGKSNRNDRQRDDEPQKGRSSRSQGRPGRDHKGGQKDGRKGKRRSPSSSLNSQTVAQKDYLRDQIRLNKYIAHAGLCSRREADEYIEQGKVRVNGKVVTELGTKVKSSDIVEVDQQKLSLEPFVYILLNKGRDTISTTDDEKDRNTVVDAIEGATGHRVYPVGRLDRNTMGLLILTNDGDLAHRLMHPSYKVKKTYEVSTNRLLSDEELNELRSGITLEDGPVNPAGVKRDPMNPYVTTISVFEGRNHLIRRIIGYFGADVTKLVRTRYAGLTDKDTRIGRWRYLKQKEINDLRKLVKLDPLSFNK